MKSFHLRGSGAFTILELVVVLGIIGILIALIFPAVQNAQRSASKAVCMSNLRNLYIGFAAKMTDGEGWPQVPPGIKCNSLEEQQWWQRYSVENMGLNARVWQCPAMTSKQYNSQNNLISYWPALFSSKPFEPYSLGKSVPWFLEMGDVHGSGALCVTADGWVGPFDDLFPTRTTSSNTQNPSGTNASSSTNVQSQGTP